ncbi:Asp-tRNA(Asn)/Glu-tRNA(Gln) amidotransferase subunit GatA, partial [uncultured Eubacterium sp.]|uniref:Asp-tRNA(Asn)/Glu-tRNA(Gln) amidotransferase subunit GatA n=1 Tax=uncultured Eubacterium sp. TaxID=165185 RepID=UPI0025FF4D10
MEIYEMTALQVAEKIKNKEITSMDAVESVAKAIEQKDGTYNCYVSLDKESALQQAELVQKKIDSGEATSLFAGVPIAIKDNICEKGKLTSCASKILSNFKPPYNATVINKLNDADMVTFGKVNMDEFAMGSTTETSFYGPTKNPWDITRVPGGSSGGAAASVAAEESIIALGSDTGGSIRQPASFCGIVGLKPTYGAVSRYGLIAYASSLDQIGPITKSVEDAAIVFDAISKRDEKDSTSKGFVGDTYSKLNNDIKGMKIGIAKEYLEGVRDDVKEAVLKAADIYKSMGAEIVYFDLPELKFALPVYYIIACAEASSNLGRYDGIRFGYKTEHYNGTHDMVCRTRSEGFGEEVKRRILLGTYVLSAGYYDAYYKKAQNLRGTIVKAFNNAFEKCDVILAPTVPMTAFEKGHAVSDPIETYLTDICTVPVNIAGLPGVSVPCGFNAKGMPIGMQLIGKSFGEAEILNAAFKY